MSEIKESKVLDEPVILNNGYLDKTYGIMRIDKYYSGAEIGTIIEDLLQKDISFQFETEEEKEKILAIIPPEFHASIEENTIIITFDKEEIEAPSYYKNEYSDSYGRQHTEFKRQEMGTIVGTIKTPELEKKISELKSTVHEIKAEMYKSDRKTYNRGRIMATRDIESFFKWLSKIGEIEIVGEDLVSGYGTQAWTDKYIYYKFKGEDKVNTVILGDEDFINGDVWGEELTELYKKHINDMKESGEYYLQGTSIPLYEILGGQKNGIYCSEDKDAVILRDGEICLTLKNVNGNFHKKFCEANDEPYIYVATDLKPEGYEKLMKNNCFIRRKWRSH